MGNAGGEWISQPVNEKMYAGKVTSSFTLTHCYEAEVQRYKKGCKNNASTLSRMNFCGHLGHVAMSSWMTTTSAC